MFQRFLEAAAANPIGSDACRSTAAAVPVIANYYLLRSLLNLHRCYCLVLSVAAGGRRFANHSTRSAEGLRFAHQSRRPEFSLLLLLLVP